MGVSEIPKRVKAARTLSSLLEAAAERAIRRSDEAWEARLSSMFGSVRAGASMFSSVGRGTAPDLATAECTDCPPPINEKSAQFQVAPPWVQSLGEQMVGDTSRLSVKSSLSREANRTSIKSTSTTTMTPAMLQTTGEAPHELAESVRLQQHKGDVPMEDHELRATPFQTSSSYLSSRTSTHSRMSGHVSGTKTWHRDATVVIRKAHTQFSRNTSGFENLGVCLRMLRDTTFRVRVLDSIVGTAILLNVAIMGINSEWSPDWWGWIVVDTVFASIFTAEALVKCAHWGVRNYFLGPESRWNTFEVILCMIAWVEVSSALVAAQVHLAKSSLFRMLRLLRLTKLIRILRLQIMADLLAMVNGTIGSVRTLFYSAVLVFFPLYAISLVLKEVLGSLAEDGQGAENFERLGTAFFTLFRCFVANDCSHEDGRPLFVMLNQHYGWYLGVLYCSTSFLMSFGLFNTIVAIYVDKAVTAAKYNDMEIRRRRLKDTKYFEAKAKELLIVIWSHYFSKGRKSKDGAVMSMEEAGKVQLDRALFEGLCLDPDFTEILRELDISEDDQLALFDCLDVNGTGIVSLQDLVVGIGQLRGEARKADIISMKLLLRSVQESLHTRVVHDPRRHFAQQGALRHGNRLAHMDRTSVRMDRTSL
eukprot:CAMPEP_0171066224 /NCGR_PEP_ID=MMETSP0766_2-20121228/7298_1 /TAXON_ID=439317 /ORGANISM="Gambierdiscus australes, Strain CAWD 149" /LENGTH=646 /DNA_ID=CAMNT_0011522381 /DNA_START=32 /DNA_END=1969 /DNA_ORIENTATION=-